MKEFLKRVYNLDIESIKELNGYDNLNFLVRTKTENYILKTYPYSPELFDLLQAENDSLTHLSTHKFHGTPNPILSNDGQYLVHHSDDKIYRLLTFLDGEFLGEVIHTHDLIQSLGKKLAELNLCLNSHDSYTLKARIWPWDIQYASLNRAFITDMPNPRDQHIVLYFFMQFEQFVSPILPKLRKQIIHNDANEWNVLTRNGLVSGFIDFGDIAHSHLINELAIALTYVCYDKEDPLDWACLLIESYHKVIPLNAQEVSVLYYLVGARLCTSVCNSAHAKIADPDNNYASISEKNAWRMLNKWLEIGPIASENRFRLAAGFSPKKPEPTSKLITEREKHISSILSMSYKQPIHMSKAAFQFMYSADGDTYLDAYNNIPHVGHSHPKVVSAGQNQMALLNTNTRYLYTHLAEYADKLLKKFPSSLNKVFFVNSGSAASDLAIRMVNHFTKREHIMVMENGYHGNTQVSIDISDYKFNNPKGQGQKDHIIKTAIPDTYKGKYTSGADAGLKYGNDVVKEIQKINTPISAFICEPIVGCAGQIPLPKNYLKLVYPAIRTMGGVCISDEVQTGFGRVGDAFWGFELYDVIPDIVILGKPIANGHPMGAVVCTDEIAAAFEEGVEFFSSFGGNPVSCAIASAVLDVIEEENLQENARIVGNYYQSCLRDLSHKYPFIGDVRGSGLFIGIEIVKPNTLDPYTSLASYIKNELRNQNILISTDGPSNNVIKTKPPLCFTKENVKSVVNAMKDVLENLPLAYNQNLN